MATKAKKQPKNKKEMEEIVATYEQQELSMEQAEQARTNRKDQEQTQSERERVFPESYPVDREALRSYTFKDVELIKRKCESGRKQVFVKSNGELLLSIIGYDLDEIIYHDGLTEKSYTEVVFPEVQIDVVADAFNVRNIIAITFNSGNKKLFALTGAEFFFTYSQNLRWEPKEKEVFEI